MADLFEKVVIDCPIEVVFETVANPKNAEKMFVNVSEVESLDDKEKQVGGKYREYRQLSNRRVGTDIEIIQRDHNKKYGFKSSSNGLSVDYVYSFQETDERKTKISFEGAVHPEKLLMRLTKPLVVRMLKKEDQDHLKYIKNYLEKSEE
ncbi:SRPBCC family protein [Salipaludibacillus daqingensis]|uniref:SRPBCC family protein n=1 Tax=Salipaludibacillus daqingensis TaxID=3041001 RepID=UPI002477074E|nr:SRPBCC family protein [Salipaludibacillus daqingensis]